MRGLLIHSKERRDAGRWGPIVRAIISLRGSKESQERFGMIQEIYEVTRLPTLCTERSKGEGPLENHGKHRQSENKRSSIKVEGQPD